MMLTFKPAVRKKAPMIITVSGTSGSGKTYSSLLMAAGLAGNGRVGMIDTENGRGSMYADAPGIKAAFPNGYDYLELSAPFSPTAYISAIDASEAAGHAVTVIDSGSHEWEGIGGCQEIAEKNKLGNRENWARAKKEHKRFVNRLLMAKSDIIICLRARDKVKIQKVNGKEEVIPIGLQPICEKNFVFEATLSLMIEEKTHYASGVKVPEALVPIFGREHLITMADGAAIARWNEGGAVITDAERISKQARLAAEDGMEAYEKFFKSLTPAARKALTESGEHADNKHIALQADADAKADAEAENLPAEKPEAA